MGVGVVQMHSPWAGGGEAGAGTSPSCQLCALPALFTLALLCSLQIMIEFCPGGAVDAIMLGESSSVQCVWGSRLCPGQASFSAHPRDHLTCEHRPLCPLSGQGLGSRREADTGGKTKPFCSLAPEPSRP